MRMPKVPEDSFERWCEANEIETPTDAPTDADIARYDAELEEAKEEWVAANCG